MWETTCSIVQARAIMPTQCKMDYDFVIKSYFEADSEKYKLSNNEKTRLFITIMESVNKRGNNYDIKKQ